MKRTLFLIFSIFFVATSLSTEEIHTIPTAPYLPAQAKEAAAKKAPITVQYPYENMYLPEGTQKTFVFGQVNLTQPATLDINGQAVELYKNGAFVAFVPVKSEELTFVLTAKNKTETVQAVRHVRMTGNNAQILAEEATLLETSAFPQRPVELLPGDAVNLYVRGTPGARVSAQLSALKGGKEILLTEDTSRPGTYRGTFQISPEQAAKTTKVVYKMTDGPDDSKDKISAPSKITVRDGQGPFSYARVTQPGVKVRKLPTASGNLYPYYRAYGIVRVNGQMANQSRLRLSDTESAWLENTHLELLESAPQNNNELSFIRTETSDERTRFIFTLNREVPLQIHEFKDRVELTLYYVDHFEQNFSLDNTSPLVSNIQWSEPAEKAVAFRILLRPGVRLWGHAYRFEDNQLILDLMHQPALNTTEKQPLKGARIVIDAGHSPGRTAPYDGAVGPTGYLEYEGSLALAQELKPLLEKAGATVLLTRVGDNQMSLQNRYDYALAQQAHLFVSLHYNALPETANPFAKPRGFSVYYTYPHSFDLAESVYNAFIKNVALADNGLIANDVLFIPRMPDYPSILVENAYLMLPEQEEMAKTKAGRAPFVKALYEGIVGFYRKR